MELGFKDLRSNHDIEAPAVVMILGAQPFHVLLEKLCQPITRVLKEWAQGFGYFRFRRLRYSAWLLALRDWSAKPCSAAPQATEVWPTSAKMTRMLAFAKASTLGTESQSVSCTINSSCFASGPWRKQEAWGRSASPKPAKRSTQLAPAVCAGTHLCSDAATCCNPFPLILKPP